MLLNVLSNIYIMIISYKKERFDFDVCDDILSHIFGLMFRFPKNDGLLLVFKKEKFVCLHTFFVFFTIDIVYIDKYKRIIKIRKRVLPFTIFLPPVKCKYVLELKNCKNLEVGGKIGLYVP